MNVLEELVQSRRNDTARVLEEHAGESDDPVERRTQFMRHVGEELVLRAIRGHETQVRFAQLVRPFHDALFERVGEPFQILVELRVFDRHRGLIGDRRHKNHVVLFERMLLVALDGDDADHAVTRDHRHAEPRLGRLRVGDGLHAHPRFVGDAADEQRLMMLHDP